MFLEVTFQIISFYFTGSVFSRSSSRIQAHVSFATLFELVD